MGQALARRDRWRDFVAIAALLSLALAPTSPGTLATFTAQTESDGNAISNASLNGPASVVATLRADGGTVDVTWTATTSAFATGHRVYRSSALAGPFTQVAQLGGLATSAFSDVPGSGTFFYSVRAYYGGTSANWESQNNIVVGPIRPLHHFAIAPIGPQHSGTAFSLAVSARASDDSVVVAFTGSVSYAVNAGTVSPTTSASLSSGSGTQAVTVTGQYGTAERITVTGGSPARNGTSDAFVLDHFRAVGIQLSNKAGGTVGLAEDGDAILITFSEAAAAASLGRCASQPGVSDSASDLLTEHATPSDRLVASGSALTIGSIDLGSIGYFSASGIAALSACGWNSAFTILTVTFHGVTNATAFASSTITYLPDPTITSAAGEAIDTGQRPTRVGSQF